ncbi:MAG: hypothetical protein ACOX5Z_12815 [Desulfobulbus sp.]|jgi:hypothetical protein
MFVSRFFIRLLLLCLLPGLLLAAEPGAAPAPAGTDASPAAKAAPAADTKPIPPDGNAAAPATEVLDTDKEKTPSPAAAPAPEPAAGGQPPQPSEAAAPQEQLPTLSPPSADNRSATPPVVLGQNGKQQAPAETRTRPWRTRTARQYGVGNAVPPLLAGLTVSMPQAGQQLISWEAFVWPNRAAVRQVTAVPPLRSGIRPAGSEADVADFSLESILEHRLALRQAEQTRESTLNMLESLVNLRTSLRQQIRVIRQGLEDNPTPSEEEALKAELQSLDKQLTESGSDFVRIATGIDIAVFSEAPKEAFSWKQEITSLLEPTIKSIKQLTARARQKTELKEQIGILEHQEETARRAVTSISELQVKSDGAVEQELADLLPVWKNVLDRIDNKLELARMELAKLEDKDVPILQSLQAAATSFFHERGLYLLIALGSCLGVFVLIRLFSRLILRLIPGARRERRPKSVRILDLAFKGLSAAAALFALFFVLYAAEDWLLLSAAIILFIGLLYAIRQTLPKMWRQAVLMLNMGSMREGERVNYQGLPWRVEAINVFCTFYNPALNTRLRVPIAAALDLISRPYGNDEPWFPCKKNDWVAISGMPFAKVVSLSHEMVEVVEVSGRHIVYDAAAFLAKAPVNLSRDFCISVVLGLPYAMQAQVTTVLETLEAFLNAKMQETPYQADCTGLTVDFLQIGISSLDVVIFANFTGAQAGAYRKIERLINRWCVECCNAQGWEIPYPQMAVHLPAQPALPGPVGDSRPVDG